MELSAEDRERIYQEEKVRLEAQEELKKDAKKKADQIEGRNFLIAIVIVAVFGWYVWSTYTKTIDGGISV